MTIAQFDIGLEELVREGLVPPYRVAPGSRPGGRVDAICTSWARWRTYDWNPPEFLPIDPKRLQEFGDTDFEASPKPSWQELRAAYERGAPVIARTRLQRELRAECRGRITGAYGETSTDDEILLRLRVGHAEAQDTERDRLRARYQALVTSLDSMALDALDEFDPRDDRHWREPDD